MLPTNAPSILTCALRLPPASTTAISIGCPISSAFRWAASMTRRASCSVMVSFVFAASAIISLSRRSLSMFALEPLRRNLAYHRLARSQTHSSIPLISSGTQPTLVQYLLERASITMKLDRYSHLIPSMGRHAADGTDEALGQSLLLPYGCQAPGGASRVFYLFTVFAGKKESRRADSNRLPLLITSDWSGVAEGCMGQQIPHIQRVFCSQHCPRLQGVACGLGSN